MTDQPITLKVVEPPADRLRRLALIPETPREDLWQAIAAAVIDINERMAELEADAEARRRVIASIQGRLSAPPTSHTLDQ
jgi:hypothetical protein